jgi:hypothetical protein
MSPNVRSTPAVQDSEPAEPAVPASNATQPNVPGASVVSGRVRRFVEGPRTFMWIGVGLLVVWLCWFGISLAQQPLPRAVPFQKNYLQDRFTYILLEPFIGLDFHHNYVAARTWRQGVDPYAELRGDPANVRYTYPPLTLVAFSWTDLFPPGPSMRMTGTNGAQSDFATSKPAILVWLAVILGLTGFAAWRSWLTRKDLGLAPLPLPFVLGATLMSYPVLFELERANCNTLPLLAIAVLVTALGRADRWRGDLMAGLCVALATGIKPYAIVLLIGLLALRRYRATAFALGWLVLQAIIFSPDLRRWLAVAHIQNMSYAPVYMDFSHSLIAHWQLIARDLGWPALAQMPAKTVTGGILMLTTLAVSWRVFRRGAGTAIAWPFLLWLAAMATMISPIAQDYNLLFIPLAVLSAWSATDSWRVQLCVGLVLLWWQPFFIGVANLPWLLLKVVSVILVGILIVCRLETTSPGPRVAPLPVTPA